MKKQTGNKSRLCWLLGTTKGAFALHTRGSRARVDVQGPWQLGSGVNDFAQDPRDPKRLVMTIGGGHLGPTVMHSKDAGKTWTEAKVPPQFEPAKQGSAGKKSAAAKAKTSRGLSVKRNFWLTPGHASEPGVWYLGTVPHGLFRSSDHGATWQGVDGLNLHPDYGKWFSSDEPPDGPFLHSVRIDPRDAARLQVSASIGGTFESRDAGKTWRPLNAGVESDFGPEKFAEYGQDPHCVIQHPANPDVFYQQNHCGIYRLDRARGEAWTRIGRKMPKKIGDIGFGIAGHPGDERTVWVCPMDGTRIWPRTPPAGKPALYRTQNSGKTWQRLDVGLPSEQGWFTVLRQALCTDFDEQNPAVAFGTTGGELWVGLDGGERFQQAAAHLPKILSVRPAML